MSLTLHVDGGARGNPGPAAAGVVLRETSGKSLFEAGYLLGVTTNNQAEYSALLLGLEAANRWGAKELTIYSDSELMVKQLIGQYRVTSKDLKPLYEDVQRALLKIASWKIQHVMRDQNKDADRLVNLALDRDEDVVEVQVGDATPRLTPRQSSTEPDHAQAMEVAVEIIHPPDASSCPEAHRTVAETLLNVDQAPGVCPQAAVQLMDAMRKLQTIGGASAQHIVQCDCGCGARFELSISARRPKKQ